GCVVCAPANGRVSPSAPLPESMSRSKRTVSEADCTGTGKNAEPALPGCAGVNCSAAPTSWAAPLSCHPPPSGLGTPERSWVVGTTSLLWLLLCHDSTACAWPLPDA